MKDKPFTAETFVSVLFDIELRRDRLAKEEAVLLEAAVRAKLLKCEPGRMLLAPCVDVGGRRYLIEIARHERCLIVAGKRREMVFDRDGQRIYIDPAAGNMVRLFHRMHRIAERGGNLPANVAVVAAPTLDTWLRRFRQGTPKPSFRCPYCPDRKIIFNPTNFCGHLRNVHQIEPMFECSLASDYALHQWQAQQSGRTAAALGLQEGGGR